MIYSITVLDCYTDEPAGLGVPPYLGVHPRYVAGMHDGQVNYITIDDLRYHHDKQQKKKENKQKTNIKTYNKTRLSINSVLQATKTLYIVIGIQTPGKYLSAYPGTLKEAVKLTKDLRCAKILAGPGTIGTQLEGGKKQERFDTAYFDDILYTPFENYDELAPLAIKGAHIAEQIPWIKMIEIETGRGCIMGKCSFCTEPLKSHIEWREQKDIHKEIKTLYQQGERHFRLGKQACILSYKNMKTQELEKLLKPIGRQGTLKLKTFHIDNVIPSLVTDERTKLLVKHCTEGNVAAFGVESFDMQVIKENTLNTSPETALKAIRTVNKHGSKRGPNGLPYFLPGINIIFGLKGERKETHEENMRYLQQIYDEKLLLRRINIRQATPFEGTPLWETGTKFIRKNKKRYWQWRNQIRQRIDYPLLKRLVPVGTILKNVQMEVHDGKHTFGRQLGTYPLIVGVNERLALKKFYNIKITKHQLRSVTGEVLT